MTEIVRAEQRRFTHVPLAADAYAIDLDTTLVASVDTTYDRTPFTTWGGYGGLTVRGPGDCTIVHDGPWSTDRLDDAWNAWVAEP